MAGVFAAFPYTRSEAIWRIGPNVGASLLGVWSGVGDFGSLGLSTAVRLAASRRRHSDTSASVAGRITSRVSGQLK